MEIVADDLLQADLNSGSHTVRRMGRSVRKLILATRRVEARGDATGEPLSVHRVRGGMWVGLFVAAQSLLGGAADVRDAALVWATLAGTLVQRPRWW